MRIYGLEFIDDEGRPHNHTRQESDGGRNQRIVKTIDTSNCPTCSDRSDQPSVVFDGAIHWNPNEAQTQLDQILKSMNDQHESVIKEDPHL